MPKLRYFIKTKKEDVRYQTPSCRYSYLQINLSYLTMNFFDSIEFPELTSI